MEPRGPGTLFSPTTSLLILDSGSCPGKEFISATLIEKHLHLRELDPLSELGGFASDLKFPAAMIMKGESQKSGGMISI